MGRRVPLRGLASLLLSVFLAASLGAGCDQVEPPIFRPGPPGGKAPDLRSLSPGVQTGETFNNAGALVSVQKVEQRGKKFRLTSMLRTQHGAGGLRR